MKHALVILTLSFVFSVNAFAKTGTTKNCTASTPGDQARVIRGKQAADYTLGKKDQDSTNNNKTQNGGR